MAQATTVSFAKLKVYLEDPAAPGVYTAPCGFNQRTFSRSKNLSDVDVPDCDDEDLPAEVGREVRSLTWSVSGEGVLAGESVAMWDKFYASSDSWNVKIEEVFPAPTGTITYTGKAHLESLEHGANRGDKCTNSVSLQSDGALTRSPSA